MIVDHNKEKIEAMIDVLLSFPSERIEDEPNEKLAAEALDMLKSAGFELVSVDKRRS